MTWERRRCDYKPEYALEHACAKQYCKNENIQYLVRFDIVRCFGSSDRYFRKKHTHYVYLHPHPSTHDDLDFRETFWLLFRAFGAGPKWIKGCICFPDYDFIKLACKAIHRMSIFYQFWLRRNRAQITWNCGGNCPSHNVKQMGTAITCHALAGNPTALKNMPKQFIVDGPISYGAYHFRFVSA